MAHPGLRPYFIRKSSPTTYDCFAVTVRYKHSDVPHINYRLNLQLQIEPPLGTIAKPFELEFFMLVSQQKAENSLWLLYLEFQTNAFIKVLPPILKSVT